MELLKVSQLAYTRNSSRTISKSGFSSIFLVNNGSHSAVSVDATDKAESPSNAIQPEADESSFSNSAPNDSISAVYGGKNETFMEDSSLDQSLDLSAPTSVPTEKISNKAETFPTVHEEVDLSNGKAGESEDLSASQGEDIPGLADPTAEPVENESDVADPTAEPIENEFDVSKMEEGKDVDEKEENNTEAEPCADTSDQQDTTELMTKPEESETDMSKMEEEKEEEKEEKNDESERGVKRPRDR